MSTTQPAPMANKSSHVHTTNDLSIFKYLTGNRRLNELHVKRLTASMSKRALLSPIIVNEKMEVIDGQNRLAALRALGLPTTYIIAEGYGLREVQILNANSKNWTASDYMDGYCDMGIRPYIQYRTFKEAYGFGHNVCMALLAGTTTTGSVVESFYDGTFEVKNYEHACSVAEMITQIAPFYDGYKRHSFVLAMIGLLKNEAFVFSEFLGKLKLQPTALVHCTGTVQYRDLIERIYNYMRRNKVNLRF